MRNTFIFLILILFSCEQELEPVLPAFEPRLVVTSVLRPDSAITVFLTENVSVLATEQPKSVTGSQINLFEDDVLIGTLDEFSYEPSEFDSEFIKALNGVYRMDYRPKAGSSYRIEVESEEFPQVTASTEIPEQTSDFEIAISEPTVITRDENAFDGDDWVIAEYTANIKINDPAGSNYYAVAVLQESGGVSYTIDGSGSPVDCQEEKRGFHELDFSSNSVIFELGESTVFEEEGGIVFNDDLFENQEFEFQITFRVWSSAVACEIPLYFDKFAIQMRSLSEEYYQYYFTTTLQKSVLEDPFAEPVQIYNNIEGGLGVFGGFNYEMFEFSMRELLLEEG